MKLRLTRIQLVFFKQAFIGKPFHPYSKLPLPQQNHTEHEGDSKHFLNTFYIWRETFKHLLYFIQTKEFITAPLRKFQSKIDKSNILRYYWFKTVYILLYVIIYSVCIYCMCMNTCILRKISKSVYIKILSSVWQMIFIFFSVFLQRIYTCLFKKKISYLLFNVITTDSELILEGLFIYKKL